MISQLSLWLVLGGWAAMLLLAMMRRRQQALDGLLRAYIQRQSQPSAGRRAPTARPATRDAAKTAPAGGAIPE